MKQTAAFLLIMLVSLPAFAQRFPRPIPRPVPRMSCQVVMVDRYNRVMNRYWGHMAGRSGRCQEPMSRCHWDLRRYNVWGARCAQVM